MIEGALEFLFDDALHDTRAGFSGEAGGPAGDSAYTYDYAEVGPEEATFSFTGAINGVPITEAVVEDIGAYQDGEKSTLSEASLRVLDAAIQATDASNTDGVTVALVAPDGSFVVVLIKPKEVG